MMTVFINGVECSVPKGSSVIQACELAGVLVPRFCYHERLSIAGNCRMCLVEIEKGPKLQPACALPAADQMRVWTETPAVKKGREGILEHLLIHHPLDCPICDQGGECDLQDQVMVYGGDRGRYKEFKRAVEDKNSGPLISMIMTRCIHCTRCVRFGSEIAGTGEFGTSGRGTQMEIGTYVRNKLFASELSGNVIDLCPVGALTSKPYSFTARSWELESTETVDATDGIGSNVKLDARFGVPMRILPRLNENINEEWISDKARFAYEGIYKTRLGSPLVRSYLKDGHLVSLEWKAALQKGVALLQQSSKAAILGGSVTQETAYILYNWISNISLETPNSDRRYWKDTFFPVDFRSTYRCNTPIAKWEETDLIILVGVQPRFEGALLNARIRKRLRNGSPCKVINFGSPISTTYPVQNEGSSAIAFKNFVEGRSPLCKEVRSATKPIILVGPSLFLRKDSSAWFAMLHELIHVLPSLVTPTWNGINYLQPSANSCGLMDIGVNHLSSTPSDVDVVAQVQTRTPANETNAVSMYIGSHAAQEDADLLLPVLLVSEYGGTLMNTEGRTQKARKAATSVTNSYSESAVVRTLAAFAESNNSSIQSGSQWEGKDSVHKGLVSSVPTMMDTISDSSFDNTMKDCWYPKYERVKVQATPLRTWVDNYYLTDTVTDCSPSLVKASLARQMFNSSDAIRLKGAHAQEGRNADRKTSGFSFMK